MVGKALDTNERPEDVTSIWSAAAAAAADCNDEEYPQGYSLNSIQLPKTRYN